MPFKIHLHLWSFMSAVLPSHQHKLRLIYWICKNFIGTKVRQYLLMVSPLKKKWRIIAQILCFFRHLVETYFYEEWHDYSGQKKEGFIKIKNNRSTTTYLEQQLIMKSTQSPKELVPVITLFFYVDNKFKRKLIFSVHL